MTMLLRRWVLICIICACETVVLPLILGGQLALASCTCQCVGGHSRSVCSSAIDQPLQCSMYFCPGSGGSAKPPNIPMAPPQGASSCSQQQVLNPGTRQYEWRTLCQ